MEITVNFYIISDDILETSKEFHSQIKTTNPIYLTLQSGDSIILGDNSGEYAVVRTIKNLHKGELDVYISKLKSKDEIMNEIEDFTSKTIKSIFESIKDTLNSEEEKDFNKA
ncbi:hypothetical protein [Clostridium kluyveri]|uniref:Uncharacterized protein n=1 Tax=Clostridium kluyveri TaxID=1534 RepID=A0A1L5F9A0_CLOKL|nr:hypothetical protein [Clostridium kluyveri]APM39598.1 hypothetical protein BS101_13045 [Clostridium kluyveri]